MSISRSFWLLLIFILSGIVVGGLLGELAMQVSWLWWLGYGQEFGTSAPFILDLDILKLTFGITVKINVASIIGLLLAVFVYSRFVR